MRSGVRIFLILSAMHFLLLGCNDDDTPGHPFTDLQVAAVRSSVDAVMAQKNVPGVMVAVWQGNRSPLLSIKGEANTENGAILRDTDPYRIASVTKTFLPPVCRRKLRLFWSSPSNAMKTVMRTLARMFSSMSPESCIRNRFPGDRFQGPGPFPEPRGSHMDTHLWLSGLRASF